MKKEQKSIKTVYAVWYWNLHCDPAKTARTWYIKIFGSQSRAETWISHNFWQFFQAEGLYIEMECEADLPVAPPANAKLLVGERGSIHYGRGGRYPAQHIVQNLEGEKHRQSIRVNWSQT